MSEPPKGRRARRAERAAMLAVSRARHFTADLGHGIHMRGEPPAPWTLETRDVPHLREMLGDDVLGAVVRALAASNRIASLVHLEKYNADSFPLESVVRKRNFYTLLWLSWATMREATTVGVELYQVAEKRLRGTPAAASLEALRDMGKRWSGKSLGKAARDGLAFHFDTKTAKAGLAEHGEPGRRLAIYAGDTLRVAEGWSELGELVMASGLGASEEQLLAFAEEGSPDQVDFSRHLFRVVQALLASTGVGVEVRPLVAYDESDPTQGGGDDQ